MHDLDYRLLVELRQEIEEIQKLSAVYFNQKYHNSVDKVAQEQRTRRLEEIKQQLAALRSK